MAECKITNEQKQRFVINPVTPKGKPAQLDGPPTWTVVGDNASGVSLDVAVDGMSAFVVSGDTPGTAQVLVEADANLDPAVKATISDTIAVEVSGALAGSLGVSAETPVEK